MVSTAASRTILIMVLALACSILKQPVCESKRHGVRHRAQKSSTCDPNYNQTRQELQDRWKQWSENNKTDCYNYTFKNNCFCYPEWWGPHHVVVVDGIIVSPNNSQELRIPTMEEIFELLNSTVVDCPESGAAEVSVEYANETEGSYVHRMYVDWIAEYFDEEFQYLVTDLVFCDKRDTNVTIGSIQKPTFGDQIIGSPSP